jgi:hypothetical protein
LLKDGDHRLTAHKNAIAAAAGAFFAELIEGGAPGGPCGPPGPVSS